MAVLLGRVLVRAAQISIVVVISPACASINSSSRLVAATRPRSFVQLAKGRVRAVWGGWEPGVAKATYHLVQLAGSAIAAKPLRTADSEKPL